MIVKNEEKNIERALSWGKDIMWEQIVVDTGSTDRTIEIAQKMGAKVFHFQWIDHFAAAKNYAIEQAQGDWIIFLDADEYLFPEDAQKLPSILIRAQNSSYHALIASWIQLDGEDNILQESANKTLGWLSTVKADGSKVLSLSGTQIRIFRNQSDIVYEGRIHEKLFLKTGNLLCMDVTQELSILHTGYTPSEMKEKDKVNRNIALIKKELEEYPDDYKMLSFLGDSYFQQKNDTEAVYWYEKAAAAMPHDRQTYHIQDAMIFKHLVLLYIKLSDETAVLDSYAKAIKYFPEDADYDYLVGQNHVEHKRFQEGEYHLQKALVLLDQYGSDGCSSLLAHNLIEAWELLILCYYENNNLNLCVTYAVTILKANPYRLKALKYLLLAFLKEKQISQAMKNQPNSSSVLQVQTFLSNFYDFHKEEDISFLSMVAKEAGYQGLLEKFD